MWSVCFRTMRGYDEPLSTLYVNHFVTWGAYVQKSWISFSHGYTTWRNNIMILNHNTHVSFSLNLPFNWTPTSDQCHDPFSIFTAKQVSQKIHSELKCLHLTLTLYLFSGGHTDVCWIYICAVCFCKCFIKWRNTVFSKVLYKGPATSLDRGCQVDVCVLWEFSTVRSLMILMQTKPQRSVNWMMRPKSNCWRQACMCTCWISSDYYPWWKCLLKTLKHHQHVVPLLVFRFTKRLAFYLPNNFPLRIEKC